jgi:hypothetical protein
MVVRRFIGYVALTVAMSACAGPAGSSSPIPSATPSAVVTPSAALDAAASPEPSASATIPLTAVLPSELNGIELHTFAVGEDILARLATQLGVARSELETAFASEHGARFLQMYAVRVRGATGVALADGWAAVAYPPEIGDVTVGDEMLAGRTITVVDSPSTAYRLGTFYLDPRGDVLIVVQAFDLAVAVEALASVP